MAIGDYGRLYSVIQSDRKNVAKNYDKLICYDIEQLLKEYFVLSGGAEIKLSAERGGGYRLQVVAKVTRIKPYGIV